jgi:hypothetical protein
MKINKLKLIVVTIAVLPLLAWGSFALASEVTGNLTTTTGNTLTGTVGNNLTGTVATPAPTSGGGGGSNYTPPTTNNVWNYTNVGILDFSILMSEWGQTGVGLSADLNKDGKVDILDFSMLMANWNGQ